MHGIVARAYSYNEPKWRAQWITYILETSRQARRQISLLTSYGGARQGSPQLAIILLYTSIASNHAGIVVNFVDQIISRYCYSATAVLVYGQSFGHRIIIA